MVEDAHARWWSIRRAQNRKPATYRCPFCGGHLPALSEHVLTTQEAIGALEEAGRGAPLSVS